MKIFFSMILVLLTCVSMANTENPRVSNETVRDSSKTLIVYFSYSHGNTKSIAEKLQKVLGADIVRLEPVTPYSHDYKKVEKQGQEEVEQQFKPKLKALGLNLKNYDRIIIGTPTWWYKMAPVVLSFMSSADFDGKKVIPFSTHAGWRTKCPTPCTALISPSSLNKVSAFRSVIRLTFIVAESVVSDGSCEPGS